MKKGILIVLAVITISCHKDVRPGCDTAATVADLTKVGASGYGFRLTDGTLLIPEQHPHNCGHNTNPLVNFNYVDSMKVKIGYIIENHHNTSSPIGKVAEITCVTVQEDEK